MRIGKRDNPFQPGFGTPPPELAGREEVKQAFEAEIRRLKARRAASHAMLLTGPRGCGKTSLLGWFRRKAAGERLQVVRFLPQTQVDLESPADSLGNPAQPGSRRICPGAHVSAPLVAIGIGGEHEKSWAPGIRKESFVDGLIKHAASGPLALVVDEVHVLNAAVAQALFTSFQDVALSHPMLLVLAGTPDAMFNLRTAHATFIERLTEFSIGRLSGAAAFDALAKPLKNCEVDFEDDVLRKASEAAENYPYFLQCWGEALWDAEAERLASLPRPGSVVWLNAARRKSELYRPHVSSGTYSFAVPKAEHRRQKLYAGRMHEFRRYDMTALIAELALEVSAGAAVKGAANRLVGKLAELLESKDSLPANSPGEMERPKDAALRLLLHTGFVWQPGSDDWEYGIPSLARHLECEVAGEIGEALTKPGVAAALSEALAFLGDRSKPREDVFGNFVESGLAEDRSAAASLLSPLERAGLIGPTGEVLDDERLLGVLTPLLARAALKHVAGASLTTCQTPSLEGSG